MKITALALGVTLLGISLIGGAPAAADDNWVFTTYAGIAGGAADGVGAHARFYIPSGAAFGPDGTAFIADSGNHTIRKITPAGVVSTFAGVAGERGAVDGAASVARFSAPQDVAVDTLGNVYVSDSENFTIRKITPEGVVSTLAGLAGSQGSVGGLGPKARFRYPAGIAVDPEGVVYVADAFDQTIRKVTPEGFVTTIAGREQDPSFANGTGSVARFNGPNGIEVAPNGNLYVADSGNNAIRRVTPAGMVSTIAGTPGEFGSVDGSGSSASFAYPFGIAVDPLGNILVSDTLGENIRRISPDGVVTTLAGQAGVLGGADGTGSAATFNRPVGIGADAKGNLLVCDFDGYSIRRVTPAGVVTTFAGVSSGGSEDGGPGIARFLHPTDVAADAHGNLFVTDAYNQTIRRISARGEVTTFAGLAGAAGSADGEASEARFAYPGNLAIAPTGDVFVSDRFNATVRKISTGGDVTTLAGRAGELGFDDGTGADARFVAPAGLAVDEAGNVFVADAGASTIRKISPAGVVKTLAGRAGGDATVDGGGSSARFDVPTGIALAPDGNFFVTEANGATIRKLTPQGIVSTFAGRAGEHGAEDGVGKDARFYAPTAIASDRDGNLFVSDQSAETLRFVTPAAAVSTIGGKVGVYGWNNGAGSDARFDSASGLTVDANGVVYIAEFYSNTIRRGVRCTSGAICALNGRFQISLSAVDQRTGAAGAGVPDQKNDLFGHFSVPAITRNARNPEVFVKMLDGREVNGRFWVFYGGLTDLEYTLSVKDTVTGETTTYTKLAGSSAGGFDVGDGVAAESCAGEVDGTPVAPPATPAPCRVDSDRLCLNAGRFGIEVAATDPRTGKSGNGVSIAGDDVFGYFALPALTGNAANPEVFVKVLDGRGTNGHYWLFFSGLTDLEYSLTVTDSMTGERKKYEKAAGSACGAFDTDAF